MDSDDDLYTRRTTTSSRGFERSISQDRAIYAIERANILFGGYRRGDANNPDTYVTSIAAVLEYYDEEIIHEVTDPRTGISTTEKFMSFMPNSGELKRYCDDVAARRVRLAELAALPAPNFNRPRLRPPPAAAGAWGTISVGPECPQYAKFCERAKTADVREWRFEGATLYVPMSWFDGPSEVRAFKPFTDEQLRELYPPRAPAEQEEIPF